MRRRALRAMRMMRGVKRGLWEVNEVEEEEEEEEEGRGVEEWEGARAAALRGGEGVVVVVSLWVGEWCVLVVGTLVLWKWRVEVG